MSARTRVTTGYRTESRRFIALLTAAGAIIGCIFGLAGWMLWDAHRAAEQYALQSSENLTAALAQDIERNIEIYDLSLQGVIEDLNLDELWSVQPITRNHILFDSAASAKHLGSIFVTDEAGKVVLEDRKSVV